jgi:quercetin dioxygenase-like cupin family protein
MSNLSELSEIAPKAIWDGVTARVVDGERITLAVVEIEPNGLVPEHLHPNEQLGLVLEGSLTFRIDGEVRELGPGGTWRILGDLPHEARAGTGGAVVVDVFTPIRSDWQELEDAPARPPRWPPT